MCCLAGVVAAAEDGKAPAGWPGWRGPTGDGQWADVPRKMPAPKLLWRMPMDGKCNAGVSADEGFVVVGDFARKTDIYRCFAVADGKAAWTFEVPNRSKFDYGPGPRATPAIWRGKVYLIGANGDAHCLDLKTGKVVWEKQFNADFGGKTPTWGYSSAPLIADGKLIVLPKQLLALDPDTGKVVWTGEASGPNYSTFLAGTFGGVRQVIGYDNQSLSGWDLKTGRRIWRLEVDNSHDYTVPSPVAVGGKLLVTSQTENTRLYGFDTQGRLIPKPLAENEDLGPEMASPVVQGELILGICQGLVCLDLNDKLKTLWIDEEDGVPAGRRVFSGLTHMVATGDRGLAFSADGVMALFQAGRAKCTVLGRAKLCEATWSHPALVGSRLYIRDEKFLYCYDLSEGKQKQ